MRECFLRELTEADIPALTALEKVCFSDPWSDISFLECFRNPLIRLTGLFDEEGDLAAYLLLLTVADEATVMNLAVAPAYRRQGLARRLMADALRHAAARGCSQCYLEVRASNRRAIELYEHCGFTVIGRRPRYYFHPREDALLMSRSVEKEEEHADPGH